MNNMIKKISIGLLVALLPVVAMSQTISTGPWPTSFILLAKSGTAASVTGTASETTLATISVPANAIGANGQMKINCYWAMTNSANSKTLRARLGGLGGTAVFSQAVTTIANAWSASALVATNSTSAQTTFSEVARGTDGLVTTVVATSAIDMTAAQSLVITGQLANTGETITLTGYTIEYSN